MSEILGQQYVLLDKDIPLVTFDLMTWQEKALGVVQTGYRLNIRQISHPELLPLPLKQDFSEVSLLEWIKKRKAPKNRQFFHKILDAISDSDNPLRYVDVSRALSLNDAYWIANQMSKDRWGDCNLYQHPFDELLSYVAFTGYDKKIPGIISSPEVTSSGMLKKCWSNRENGIYLLKGDDFIQRPDGRSQATMEFYAGQVATVMGLEHIPYDLEEFHHQNGTKELICTCKLFTDEDVGFINAFDFYTGAGMDAANMDMSSIKVQELLANTFGFDLYADMMVFDAVICNQDRHLGNFGYLIDNNTNQPLRPAPIFDNGASLVFGAANHDLEHIETYLQEIQGKYLDFDLQAQLFVQPRHIPKLRALTGFVFQKHPCYNVADTTIKVMNQMIQIRARRILDLYKKKCHTHKVATGR